VATSTRAASQGGQAPESDIAGFGTQTSNGSASIERGASALTTMDAPLSLPAQSLGRFELRGTLGAGGLGVVYEAYDPELDRRVAIKLVRVQARGNEDEAAAQARLLREAQVLAKLSHHNVIHVYDVGTLGDRVYVAMEIVEGGSLRAWLSERPRRWRDVVALFLAAGQGLAAAHAAGLVHRDFKPENVLVDRSNRPFVVDFGLAKACEIADARPDANASASRLSALLAASTEGTGVLVGTPNYMAPEQFKGTDVGPPADQFAFCVALWEALFGERPFHAHDVDDLAAKVTRGDRRNAPSGRGVPTAIRRVLERGLRVKPAERWPSMEVLCARLTSVTRARARQAIALGVVASAIGSAALGKWLAATDRCTGFGASIAAVWNPSHAAALQERLESDARRFSGPTAAAAIRELDAITNEWIEASRSACQAASRGEEPANVHAAQVSCLDARHRGIVAAIASIEQLGAERVEDAMSIAQSLPRPARCLDARVIGPWVEPPSDETTAEEVEEIRGQLAERFAGAATRLHDAEVALEGLLARAEELGYAPLVAEAGLAAGDIHDRAGHLDPAHERITSALWTAQGAADLDTVVRAATQLVYLDGVTRNDFSSAKIWRNLATSSLQARGDDPRLRADLENAWAGTNLAAAYLDEAAAGFDRAIETYSTIFSSDDPRLIPPMNNAAIVAAKRGDFGRAEELLESALTVAESAFGPWHPDVANLLHTMGEVAFNKGDLLRARIMFERAIEVRESALGPDHPLLATTLHNLAIVSAVQDGNDAAEPLLRRALAISSAAEGRDNPTALIMRSALANLAAERKQFDIALAAHREILAVLQHRMRPSHPEVTKMMGNVAADLMDLGQNEAARATLLAQVQLLEQEHGSDVAPLGEALRRLGDLDRNVSDYATAIVRYERAVSLGDIESAEMINARFGLALALRKVGADETRARKSAEEALALARATDDRRTSEIVAWLEAN
jgi:eukaryotic-like serine/threonine-protein kinase